MTSIVSEYLCISLPQAGGQLGGHREIDGSVPRTRQTGPRGLVRDKSARTTRPGSGDRAPADLVKRDPAPDAGAVASVASVASKADSYDAISQRCPTA